MKHFFKIIPFLTLAFAPLLNATAHTIPLPQAERAHSPLGYWKTADGKAKVHIYNCGEDICGKIIALKERFNSF